MVIYFVILVYVVGDDYKILYKYILSGAILSEWNPAGMIIQPVSRGSSDLAIWFCLEITPKLMLYHPFSLIFPMFPFKLPFGCYTIANLDKHILRKQ